MTKNNTDSLINDLAVSAKVEKPFSVGKTYAKWSAFSFLYILILGYFLNFLPNLAELVKQPEFLAEMSILLFLIIFSSFSCVYLAIPDAGQKKSMLVLPLIPLSALIIFCLMIAIKQSGNFLYPGHEGIMCTTCITLSSLIPAGFLFWEIKKAAPTKLKLIGFFCLLYAASLGAFTLRLTEQVDSYEHIIMWHYLPMFVIGGLGAIISQKILKW